MHGFTKARTTLIDYVTRFNQLVLSVESDSSIEEMTLAHQESLGTYPRVPEQWKRRMQYRYATLNQLREHRQHTTFTASCQMCNTPELFYGLGLPERGW